MRHLVTNSWLLTIGKNKLPRQYQVKIYLLDKINNGFK